MPYRSRAQVGYMHAQHPEIAKRWDREYGVPKDLPERKSKKQAAYGRARDNA